MRSKLLVSAFCAVVLVAGVCGSGDKKSSGAASSGATSPSTNAPPAGDPIKLSVVAPVDGIAAQPEILSGAEAAVAAVNDAGGITDPAWRSEAAARARAVQAQGERRPGGRAAAVRQGRDPRPA